ncbi:MAG: ORF6N domain-containing protein [Paludibacteraceae bacterium]|nr:ORF6N domain-containing protein [Paludibacteraceae bacterium]
MGKEAEIQIVNSEQISSKIYEIRGQKVMLDSDLAQIYGYSTKDFNYCCPVNVNFNKKIRLNSRVGFSLFRLFCFHHKNPINDEQKYTF